MKYVAHSPEEMKEVATDILSRIEPKDEAYIVALQGELGAGKTTFAQFIAKLLGVDANITSPTYVIQKTYDIEKGRFKKLVHIDAYRLEDESELLALKWQDIQRDPANIILVEWPEKVSGLIPDNSLWIRFEHEDEGTRIITTDDE